MAREDDEPTPRRPMTKCEVLEWFFGSRFTCDARPERCAECPANTPAPLSAWARRCGSDGEGD